MGAASTRWAKGSPAKPLAPTQPDDGAGTEVEDESVRLLREQLEAAAARGTDALRAVWRTVPPALKPELTEAKETLKAVAAAAAADAL